MYRGTKNANAKVDDLIRMFFTGFICRRVFIGMNTSSIFLYNSYVVVSEPVSLYKASAILSRC
ncbi:hypothetical protein SAMN04488500_107141 [Sporomusa malonica]|uniref:Uncharacterized protein n=1 Tax=Sporomusa malonica TaxID=112901 RepID=A0A1W2BF20_9FIRM|nr:hypothetical protein SAMN04488500_107141 [Sporomusa malonica]